MATAPTVPNFSQWDFKLNDTDEILIKDAARNAALKQFGDSLTAMTDSINTDLQTMGQQKTDTQQAAQAASDDAEQIALDKQAVADDRTHIDQQKGIVDTKTQQVSTAAQQVATDRQAVADDRLASEQAAGASTDAATSSIQAKNDAQALYGDLAAVDTAKTEAQQAATTAGEERGLAVTARQGAEAARDEADQTVNQAITDHKEENDPHSQYAKSADLGDAAAKNTGTGAGDVPTTAEADGRYAQLAGANEFSIMPTVGGASVVESDSNSDGEWTRYSTGRQECELRVATTTGTWTSQGALYRSGFNKTWIFPASFIDMPKKTGAIQDGSGALGAVFAIKFASGTSTNTGYEYWGTEGGVSRAVTNCLKAVGDWK